MMISPVIFCTIVLGVGSVRSAAQVGKVGGLALGYFLAMSTVALAIGLVVGNLLAPRRRPAPHRRTSPRRAPSRPARRGSTTDFLLGIIPTTLFSSLTEGEVLQTLLVALLVGFALQAMGRAGEPILRGVEHLQRLVFRVLAMIMWAAPVGAFGAMAAVVGETGVDALKSLAVIMLGFYITCAVFVFGVLGAAAAAGHRRQPVQAAALPGPGVPADPVDLVVGVGAAAADRQDGARRRRASTTVGVVVPTGYSFNLDGTAIYLTMASLFIAEALGKPLRDRRADLAAGVHDHRLQGRRRGHRRGPGHAGRRAVLAPSGAARRRRPDRRHRPLHVRGAGADQLRRQRRRHGADRHLDRRSRPRPARRGAGRRRPFDETTMLDGDDADDGVPEDAEDAGEGRQDESARV